MSEVNNIPKHWQVKKLVELCELQNGVAFKSSDYIEKSNTLIFRMSQIRPGGILDLNHNSKYLPDEFIELYRNYLLKDSDIVIAMTDMASETKILGVPTYFKSDGRNFLLNQRVGKLFNIHFDQINDRFLRYALTSPSVTQYYKSFGKGALQINLGKSDILNVTIPIPPLPEQQAIVSKIEELLSDLENGKQQLQIAQQQLKIYRQSLLKCAFEGKLTNKNVKDGELPKGWKVVDLKEVVDKISDGPFGSNLKSIDYINEGIRVIRLENIGEMEFRNEYKTFVSPEKYETIKNHTVGKGDIIFSSFISESIRSVILPDYIEKAINKADCFLIRVSETKINKKYLSYYFSTKAMRNQLVDQIHGATRPRINTTQLKTAIIPFAPLKEQQLIVDELESKLTVCDKIEETISQSLLQAESLRQSILKKAFEGKLV